MDNGLSAPDDLAAQVDEAIGKWRQGDVLVDLNEVVHLANPGVPLTAAATEAAAVAADEPLIDVWTEAPAGVVVISQTCDVVRSPSKVATVLVAPVVKLPEPQASDARAGRILRYAPLSGVGQDAFADFDMVMTIEKGLLLAGRRVEGCRGQEEAKNFASAISRRLGRFAFPDDFTQAIAPMLARLKEKARKQSKEGRAIEALWQIRVEADPSWDAAHVDTVIHFIIEPRATPLPPGLADSVERGDETWPGGLRPEEWDTLVQQWVDRWIPTGPFRSLTGIPAMLDDVDPRIFRFSEELCLDHVSAPQAAGGEGS